MREARGDAMCTLKPLRVCMGEAAKYSSVSQALLGLHEDALESDASVTGVLL